LQGKENFETSREKRGAGRRFFWILFFGRAKKSIDKKKDIIISYAKSELLYDVSGNPNRHKPAALEMIPES
jgi:hypothetical protein